jgi:cytoskeletal protein CcmA (bactofilin family)
MRDRRKRVRPSPDPGLPRDVLGFLGAGNRIEGELDLTTGLRVDGRIVGRVRSPSTLVVGPTGEIESDDLHVRALSVSGLVRGKLRIGERLEIRRGGRVFADVIMECPGGVVLEPGAVFDGTVKVEGAGSEEQTPCR